MSQLSLWEGEVTVDSSPSKAVLSTPDGLKLALQTLLLRMALG